MAASWELICHHTYAGFPGAAVDISPAGASDGAALGLVAGDFLTDGVTPGSGAVRLFATQGRIHVAVGTANLKTWQPLDAIKAEVTFRREPWATDVYTLIHSDAFHFYIRGDNPVAWFRGTPLSYTEASVQFDSVTPQPYRVPHGQWVTLGFRHDGISTIEITANGQVVARKSGVFARVAPIASTGGITIGNVVTGDIRLNGEIDELKVWRRNPHRMTDDFFSRPMDEKTADCWTRFMQALRDALRRHPECAREISRLLQELMDRQLRLAMGKGPETRERLHRASRKYNELWASGAVGTPEMTDVFADIITWMRLNGVVLERDPAFRALERSECLARMIKEVSPPDCDDQVVALLKSIMEIAGGRR